VQRRELSLAAGRRNAQAARDTVDNADLAVMPSIM